MGKKLPGVFPGKVKKDSGNNRQVFYSSNSYKEIKDDNKDINVVSNSKTEENIYQKLNKIFNSPNYIYKADVEIKLKNETVIKRIVGRNNNYLLTMENELISIDNIKDIKMINK